MSVPVRGPVPRLARQVGQAVVGGVRLQPVVGGAAVADGAAPDREVDGEALLVHRRARPRRRWAAVRRRHLPDGVVARAAVRAPHRDLVLRVAVAHAAHRDAGLGGGGEQAARRRASSAATSSSSSFRAAARRACSALSCSARAGSSPSSIWASLSFWSMRMWTSAANRACWLIASCLSASAASASALRARASATAASLLAFSVRSCSWAAWYSANSSASLVVRTSRIAHLRLALVDDSSANIDRADSVGGLTKASTTTPSVLASTSSIRRWASATAGSAAATAALAAASACWAAVSSAVWASTLALMSLRACATCTPSALSTSTSTATNAWRWATCSLSRAGSSWAPPASGLTIVAISATTTASMAAVNGRRRTNVKSCAPSEQSQISQLPHRQRRIPGGGDGECNESRGHLSYAPHASSCARAYGARRALERVTGSAVDVVGDDSFVPVARRRRARRLEHQDRSARGGRLVLRAPGDHEGIALVELHQGLVAVAVPDCDVEAPLQHQEELVGVLVDVPHMVAARLGDAHVVVVHPGDDAGTVDLVERRQRLAEIDRLRAHTSDCPPAPPTCQPSSPKAARRSSAARSGALSVSAIARL